MSSSSFLVHPKSSIEVNFSELVLLNYCCVIIQYMKFLLEKTFVICDRFSQNNVIVQAEVCVVLN